MKNLLLRLCLVLSSGMLLPVSVLAEDLAPLPAEPEAYVDVGDVRLPLAAYQAMLQQLQQDPRPAPAAYAIGRSDVAVTVVEEAERISALVGITVTVETFEEDWTLVPLLPTAVALESATANGRPVQLIQGPGGLAWSRAEAGVVTLQLAYKVDAQRSDAGYVLALPVPQAAATRFALDYPGSGLDLAVVPAADQRSVEAEGRTRITANVPATGSILVSWRAASSRPFAISRAAYSGALRDDALIWTAAFEVEVFTGELITLPLLPDSVTLNDIRVDGAAATVLEDRDRFATLLQGRGRHSVEVTFQVPVLSQAGPPSAAVPIPRIPVSRFDLLLPGKKDLKVTPAANVVALAEGDDTKATAYIPMSDRVVFSWTNAIPDDLQTQLRANASLYHLVHAEEGVLQVHAIAVDEITHGETSVLAFDVPARVQVNRVSAPEGGVSDWTVSPGETPELKRIKVFLERPVSGNYVLDVAYELLLGGESERAEPVAVPLLTAVGVHRQRGMVALLAGQELTLRPVAEDGVSQVGENQLPAFVRNQIAETVAHTYKYIDPAPQLQVRAVAPERRKGRFDAQVDSLISLGEVTMKAASTIEIDVKSGSIADLTLKLPENVNILGVSSPSLRDHREVATAGGQTIELAFTREMSGRFRVEMLYERIMDTDAERNPVPIVAVTDAEVEHGRIAVEALTAVEVRAALAEQLSSLDINELPQQLILKTSNPILLAFRYAHAKPPLELALKITRHREIDVQVAAIERADYSTLFTKDGLAVTTARLLVRNSRRQFLRLTLPEGSAVWSVFVDGKAEKPAYPSDAEGDGDSEILVKMINSAKGFPVDIVYATSLASMGPLGVLSAHLPRPDMVVTHSRWDAYLPVGPHYQAPDSNMDLIVGGVWANPRAESVGALMQASDAQLDQFGQPLKITVPTQGRRFTFEKLYANQSPEDAGFSIRYLSASANWAALFASGFGVLLVWGAILAVARPQVRQPRAMTLGSLGLGVALLVVSIGYLGSSFLPASVLALLIALCLAVYGGLKRLRVWRAGKAIG